MELTKEQIQFIDHRLENDGIKYWDIRIEMLDHVVSDVEIQLEKGKDFKKAVQNSFISLGWNGSLSSLNRKGWQNVNKGYRKMYHQGFIDFFKKSFNIFCFLTFMISYYFLSKNLEHKTFIKVSYLLFALPMLLYFYAFYKTWRKKLGKSIHRDYALNYLMLSFLILNGFMNFIRVDDDFSFPIEYHKPLLFFIIPLQIILTISGYNVYQKAIAKVEKMRKELL